MLDHVSITVHDLAAAGRFYDAVLGCLGHARVGASDRWIGYGTRNAPDDDGHCYLSIILVPDRPPRLPDRRHWAFRAATRDAVDRFHALALATGGRSDGAPGLRPEYHSCYYAAFVLDPDGNRIEAVCHRPPST